MITRELVNIFKEVNLDNINNIIAKTNGNKNKMRTKLNGILLSNLLLYRFLYTKLNKTKEMIVSYINIRNKTKFHRQSFNKKENNIPFQIYVNIFDKIRNFYNCNYNISCNFKILATDGTYNNNHKGDEVMNMGFYDVTNNIPIDIKSFGKENKNREICSATNYIKNNMHIFINNIIVADRGYFSYDFLNFLNSNKIKFIIRVKGEAENLKQTNVLNKNTQKYETILNLRKNIRIITYNNILHKTIYASNSKKSMTVNTLEIQNNCVIVTNILDKNEFSDTKILELYKSRWDIEVFFKYIKSNFKFQHLKEHSCEQINKMYICELILIYIAKIIEKNYMDKNKNKIKTKEQISYKINKSHLVNGIFDNLLVHIIEGTLTDKILNEFQSSYIKIIQNKKGRSFPRTSKTPFSKWYIKGYSNLTKYKTIIDAIINNEIENLNKNLKMIAKKIISINGIKSK